MKHPDLKASLTVAETLSHWPQAAQVFFRHRMACIGCAMSPFDTLADVAAAYNLDLNRFLGELRQIISAPGPHLFTCREDYR